MSHIAYTIAVSECRSGALTGLGPCSYHSPEHTSEEAADLLRVLLGRDVALSDGRWVRPVAGGSQEIEVLQVEADDA